MMWKYKALSFAKKKKAFIRLSRHIEVSMWMATLIHGRPLPCWWHLFLLLPQLRRGLHLNKRYRNLCSFFKAHISWWSCHSLNGQSSDDILMTDLFQSTVGLTFEDERRWQRSSELLNVTVSFKLTLWGCKMHPLNISYRDILVLIYRV